MKVKGTPWELNKIVYTISQLTELGVTIPEPWPWARYGGRVKWVTGDLRVLQLTELLEDSTT